MALQSSQRLPELLFYMKKSYRILQLQFQLQLQFYMCTLHYTTLQSREFSIQNTILHAEDKELFEYYYYITEGKETFIPDSGKEILRIERQGDLLEIHLCVLQTFQTFQSFMTFQPFQAILQILQVPVFPGNPTHSSILRLECIFYSSIGFQKTSPSAS